jgi:hypothetical protein
VTVFGQPKLKDCLSKKKCHERKKAAGKLPGGFSIEPAQGGLD